MDEVENVKEFQNPCMRPTLKRICFLILLSYTLFSCICLFWVPALLFYSYSVLFFIMLLWRAYTYYFEDQLLFLLSPCYFVNIFMIAWLILLPDNAVIGRIIFGLTNGPIYAANFIFRSTLAFGCPDKYYTCIIHLVPLLITFNTRWFPDKCSFLWFAFTKDHPTFEWAQFGAQFDPVSLYVVPLACVLGHILIYNFIVHLLVRPAKRYSDLTRYTIQNMSLLVRFGRHCSAQTKVVSYIVLFSFHTAFVLLLAVLMYCTFIANVIFLSISAAYVIWCTASYYVYYVPKQAVREKQPPPQETVAIVAGEIPVCAADHPERGLEDRGVCVLHVGE